MQDISRLEKEKTFLHEVKMETNERLERFKPVKAYLEKVQEASNGQFRSIRELFDSYDTLSNERTEMTKLHDISDQLVHNRQKVLDMLSSVSLSSSPFLYYSLYGKVSIQTLN
jgi:hypothetical protein